MLGCAKIICLLKVTCIIGATAVLVYIEDCRSDNVLEPRAQELIGLLRCGSEFNFVDVDATVTGRVVVTSSKQCTQKGTCSKQQHVQNFSI